MRRAALIAAVILGSIAFVAAVPADDSGSGDEYLVRAVFDNGSFIVADEDVRVAGANVGNVESVDVSLPDEVVSREPGEEVQPGKAIVVLNITDPAFQDFRTDATCILRPQSLIGERYVDCRPTLPRSDPEDAPPPLEQIPDDQPGAGQYLLPLENNGTNVDIDLLQNIQRRPFADRLRIILNELGAGFAARGEDIAEIVERSDPTLREVNRVIAILSDQRDQLAQLATDSERIMEEWAGARTGVSGFIDNAGEAAAATAERRPDLELALARFPGFLVELRSTMREFEGFANAALPVTRQLGIAAPSLTEATQATAPFAGNLTSALRSFGDAAEGAGPKLAAADPIVRQARELARTGEEPTKQLAQFLGTTKRTGGFEQLMRLIYNTTGTTNGFDELGHFMRTTLVATNCFDYVPGYQSGCQSRFEGSESRGQSIISFPGLIPEAGLRPEANRERGDAGGARPAGRIRTGEPMRSLEALLEFGVKP